MFLEKMTRRHALALIRMREIEKKMIAICWDAAIQAQEDARDGDMRAKFDSYLRGIVSDLVLRDQVGLDPCEVLRPITRAIEIYQDQAHDNSADKIN